MRSRLTAWLPFQKSQRNEKWIMCWLGRILADRSHEQIFSTRKVCLVLQPAGSNGKIVLCLGRPKGGGLPHRSKVVAKVGGAEMQWQRIHWYPIMGKERKYPKMENQSGDTYERLKRVSNDAKKIVLEKERNYLLFSLTQIARIVETKRDHLAATLSCLLV